MGTHSLLKKNLVNINDVLTDKSYVEYQKSPTFVEIYAILCKFGKVLKVNVVSFVELEQALDLENDNCGSDKSTWIHSNLLKNLYTEILSIFVHINKNCNSDELNLALFKLLKKLSITGVQISSEILSVSDVYDLSSIQKLSVICILLNEALNLEKIRQVIETFETDDLRIHPFYIDQNGNKLWYFGDTYLFFEADEDLLPKRNLKTRKTRSVKQINEVSKTLFTGNCFYLVCRTPNDWGRVIEAYNAAKEFDLVAKLTKTLDFVSSLENKRLKEKIKNTTVPRASSRIQFKFEEKKRQTEIENKHKEEERIQREAEIKRLLEEKQLNVVEQKQAMDEVLMKKTNYVASREERRLCRERQRIQQLEERERRAQRRKIYSCATETILKNKPLDVGKLNSFSTYSEKTQTWSDICNGDESYETTKKEHSLLDEYLKTASKNETSVTKKKKIEFNVCKLVLENANNQSQSLFQKKNPIITVAQPSNIFSVPSSSTVKRIVTNLGQKVVIIAPNANISSPVYCLDRNGQLQKIKSNLKNGSIINEKASSSYSNRIVYDSNESHNYVAAPPIPVFVPSKMFNGPLNSRVKNIGGSFLYNQQIDAHRKPTFYDRVRVSHYQNGLNNHIQNTMNSPPSLVFSTNVVPRHKNIVNRTNSDHDYSMGRSFSHK